MTEYLDIARIDDWDNLSIIDDDGYAKYVDDVGELPRADVVEQKKIDKAYKEMEDLFNTSLEECPLSEMSFRCGLSYAMDILVHDVGVGENNNENTE